MFTPEGYTVDGQKTEENTWLFAKMHVLATDTSVHESVKHLGMSHLYCESFAIAHHNCFVYSGWFSSNHHPIGQLLDNHIGNILAINALARKTLVAEYDNTLDEFM